MHPDDLHGYYLGMMSGTSADAVDAALVWFEGGKAQLVCAKRASYPPALRAAVLELIAGAPTTPQHICRIDAELGRVYAELACETIAASGLNKTDIRAIGCHGQTLCHLPHNDPPATWQLGDASQIAARTGIDTVADFRHADLAAGGQGAPLAPAFHAYCMGSDTQDRCILNLGGIANITVLPADRARPVIGFDTGPANALLDLWAQQHLGRACDEAGSWAAAGQVEPTLLAHWLQDPYFTQPPPKSTGREYFNRAWMGEVDAYTPQNIQCTLVELSAITIAKALDGLLAAGLSPNTTLYACGGGVHNNYLMARIAAQLQGRKNLRLDTTTQLGIDPQHVEPMLMAWLAARRLAHLPGNLCSVTGAQSARLCGAIYPGY